MRRLNEDFQQWSPFKYANLYWLTRCLGLFMPSGILELN
jgi:hypothetical protein